MPTHGRFVGGPLNGREFTFYGTEYTVAVCPPLPPIGEMLRNPQRRLPDARHVTYVRSAVEGNPLVGEVWIMRPAGSFRRDGKPVDPSTN